MSASTALGDPKPQRGDAKRQRARKRRGLVDQGYRDFLSKQPCLVAGCYRPVEIHHERSISGHDHDAGPLCKWHHRGGPMSRHGEGPKGTRSLVLFEAMHGINWRAETRRLRGTYLATE